MGVFPMPPPDVLYTIIVPMHMISYITSGSHQPHDPWVVPSPLDVACMVSIGPFYHKRFPL